MKIIEIDVGPVRGVTAEFVSAWAGQGRPPRITFESASAMHTAISDKRLELMRAVAAAPGMNVRQLAQHLGRDYKNVHGDVVLLVDLGLLERDAAGELSAPYDEIVIHASLRVAA